MKIEDSSNILFIREKIEKIINDSHNEEDVEELISSLYKILSSLVSRVRTRAIEKAGYGKEDVINIALSSLFVEDKEKELTTIRNLFAPLIQSGSSLQEFSRFLYATLRRRVKEALANLLSEIYPFKTKLRISFLNILRNSKELYYKKYGNNIYIWLREFKENSYSPVSYKVVLSESISSKLWNKKPSVFLFELLTTLKNKGICAPVTLGDIVDAYVALNPLLIKEDSLKETSGNMESKEIEMIIDEIIRELEKKNKELVNLYVQKRKISESHKDAFVKAVNDIIYDWLHLCKEGSFYRYLLSYTTEIDPSSYRREKRKILEYLVKRSKKFVREKILIFFKD